MVSSVSRVLRYTILIDLSLLWEDIFLNFLTMNLTAPYAVCTISLTKDFTATFLPLTCLAAPCRNTARAAECHSDFLQVRQLAWKSWLSGEEWCSVFSQMLRKVFRNGQQRHMFCFSWKLLLFFLPALNAVENGKTHRTQLFTFAYSNQMLGSCRIIANTENTLPF